MDGTNSSSCEEETSTLIYFPHQSDEHSSDITMLCTSIEEEEDMKERWSSRNAIDFSLPGTTAKTTKLLVVVGQ